MYVYICNTHLLIKEPSLKSRFANKQNDFIPMNEELSLPQTIPIFPDN